MKRRRRLVAAIATLTFVTLGGAFLVVYLENNNVQEHQLDAALLREAAEEAREIASTGGRTLMISARPGPLANDVGPLTKYAALYDREGRVLAQTRSFEGHPPALPLALKQVQARPFNLWHRSEHLRGVWAAVPGRPDLQLMLAAPRTDLDGDEAFLARAMLGVFLVAFVWSLLVSIWLVGRFTRGHESIAKVARRVAHGDLSARVVDATRDAEVAQLSRDVNHMIDRLSSLLASHRLFVAHAAHELRSPLTALYGELSHGLRKPREAAAYRQVIEEALESTERLKTLTEDLLALARLSADAERGPLEVLDLVDVIERARQAVSGEAEQLGITLQIARTGELRVEGKPLELERLFRNLLENAVRHAPPRSAVELLPATGPGGHRVHVINGGRPIPAEDHERIFEPFVRGAYESAEGRPGAGLGLTIARQVATNHGGGLRLNRERTDGVELIVTLPADS
jgi:two-component system OmpR family sensor kinase